MKKTFYLFTFSILTILAISLPLLADPIPTMTVSEIQQGMKGIGRTVIKGTEIEEFKIEVIGIFAHMGYNRGPLIFVRLSGDVIDRSGGIAGGYSGSPVFIDGKLIGAISWGPWYTEGDVAGVTPINDMLKAFTYGTEDPKRISFEPECLDEPIKIADRTFDSVITASFGENPVELENIYGPDTLILTPCATPLQVSGFSPEGIEKLREFAKDKLKYLDIIEGPGGATEGETPMRLGPVDLSPGASIGAQLVSGDLDLTAVGTLTWIDDNNRFLAFGHPFMNEGHTNMPFVTTRIIHTMAALDRSYKLGEVADMVGTITEDRLTSVGGYFSQAPDMIDFEMKVTDSDINHSKRFRYSVVNNEMWLPFLGMLVPMEGLAIGMDRNGPGTCRVKFEIDVDGFEKPITRDNLIYSAYDVSSEALMEFSEAMGLLTSMNPYKKVRIKKVNIEVEVSSVRQTADLLKARFNNAPNMGPGAVGYAGPEAALNDKKSKDDRINQESETENPESSDTQQPPFPEQPFDMSNLEMPYPGMGSYQPSTLVGYHPGDTIEVLVTLREYRGEKIEKVIKLKIPADFPAGQTSIEIMGGINSYYNFGYMYDLSGMSSLGVMAPPDNLEDSIAKLTKRDVNNSVIVRLTQTGPTDPYFYLQDSFKPLEEVEARLNLSDVVFGYFSLPVEILGENQQAYPIPAGPPVSPDIPTEKMQYFD
ncbi:MAG: SpoIVB peptidase S55 domain-containing protein [bacterium]